MRSFLPARRLFALSGAAIVGVTAALTFSAAANADVPPPPKPTVSGTAECVSGEFNLTWTVTNFNEGIATLSNVQPSGITGITNGTTIPASTPGGHSIVTGTQKLPGTTKSASLSVTVNWPDDEISAEASFRIDLSENKCEAPAPSPTPSATPSSAPPLPVTGAKTGAYAGAALALLASGAGLFLVARRRRTNFEA